MSQTPTPALPAIGEGARVSQTSADISLLKLPPFTGGLEGGNEKELRVVSVLSSCNPQKQIINQTLPERNV
ncbi:MAG: hypothetical protein A2161_03035 [Candidatus Schekmanbacteria bacterium RBG_13_48_7]|uniref:Uncharacterized protein n=1 Tax=Candidatus Schekmanbacteria bacterium RBG_13_48_7 TaxID=1817878 RepID=A0A1F7RXX9_9BACT|nr:MAG: hypothetical protein A2161_03035 [Candidatus Schekmanbacteria bacterium RBG_13_48_7]